LSPGTRSRRDDVTTTAVDIRRAALALPDVTEGTHFGLQSYKVRDKTFVTIQKGETHAILHVDRETAESAAMRRPASQEAVSRNDGKIFVGLRVDLAATAPAAVAELVRLAWRNRAPERLAASLDADEPSGRSM
jgi:hypothetical protein